MRSTRKIYGGRRTITKNTRNVVKRRRIPVLKYKYLGGSPSKESLTPPIEPEHLQRELNYISNELGRVEKERDELLVNLANFNSEIDKLKKNYETMGKKKSIGEDFLIKIIALSLKLNTIAIFGVYELNTNYMTLNDYVVKVFTEEASFEDLKKIVLEINSIQKQATKEIREKLNENMDGIKEILDKLGESDFKQIEKIFKEMNFNYESILTPELMKTPSPSPPGEDYKQAVSNWLGSKRQSKYRFIPGKPLVGMVNNIEYETILSPSGRRSPIGAAPREGKVKNLETSDNFNLAQPLFRRTVRAKKEGRGSREKRKRKSN